MPLRPDMDVRDYLEVLGDWKWFILFNFLFILLGAVAYLVVVPPSYKSTTTILIIPQGVSENYVQSTVSIGAEGRLSTIQQQVTSRTVLGKVINELGLFPELMSKSRLEAAIEAMRKRIEIEVVRDPRRDRSAEAFSISFVYENPELAMQTTSRLTSLFIEENLRTREQQAVGTSEFLESQLQETKEKLEIQEEKIKQYKLRFMGELPQEVQTNVNSLARLQDYFRMNADRMRAAEDRKVFLEARISTLERVAQPAFVGQDPLLAEDPARMLLIKRAQIGELSSRYTENHPTLINLRKEVAELEKRLQEAPRETSALPASKSKRTTASSTNDLLYPSRQMEEMRLLKAQIVSTDAGIASLEKENERIQQEIEYLQNKVDSSPRREQELIALTRDYDNLKSSYDSLLKKRLEANISENLEERQKGEQFHVLDPANLPERPFKPVKKKVLLFALLLASGFGFGGAIGLEGMEETLRGAKEFQHFFKLRVFACIPDVDDKALARRQALRRGAIIGGFMLFFIGILALLWLYEGKIRAILQI